jgi:hypothetical protein
MFAVLQGGHDGAVPKQVGSGGAAKALTSQFSDGELEKCFGKTRTALMGRLMTLSTAIAMWVE